MRRAAAPSRGFGGHVRGVTPGSPAPSRRSTLADHRNIFNRSAEAAQGMHGRRPFLWRQEPAGGGRKAAEREADGRGDGRRAGHGQGGRRPQGQRRGLQRFHIRCPASCRRTTSSGQASASGCMSPRPRGADRPPDRAGPVGFRAALRAKPRGRLLGSRAPRVPCGNRSLTLTRYEPALCQRRNPCAGQGQARPQGARAGNRGISWGKRPGGKRTFP